MLSVLPSTSEQGDHVYMAELRAEVTYYNDKKDWLQ